MSKTEKNGTMYDLTDVSKGGQVVGRAPTPSWKNSGEMLLEEMVEMLGGELVADLANRQLIADVSNKVRTRKGLPSAAEVVKGISAGTITTQQVADRQAETGETFTDAGCALLGLTVGKDYIGWAELNRAMKKG